MIALVFTDIVGSTALQREVGDQTYTQIRQAHFDNARTLIAGTNAYEIKTVGDSFFVVFRTAIEALDFAVALHQLTGHELVQIRVGVHVGTVRIEEDGDVYGSAVNYTKRVMDSADKLCGIIVSRDAKSQIEFEKAPQHQKIFFNPFEKGLPGFDDKQLLFRALSSEIRAVIIAHIRRRRASVPTSTP